MTINSGINSMNKVSITFLTFFGARARKSYTDPV